MHGVRSVLSGQGKRMKVCDPMTGALSGRSQVRKPCRTRQRAGSQSRLLTYLRDRQASCVSPGSIPPNTLERINKRLGQVCMALSQSFGVYGSLSMRAAYAPPNRRGPMILNALVEKLKRRSKDDFKGRHYEAPLILQAVSWYLRYPLSYRDIEELFLERGLEVDPSTLNRWVLAYPPLIERRLRTFRKPHCGSIRADETYVKVRGQWRYLSRAIDKHGTPVDFLLTAKRDLEAAKRFFRKMLKGGPLLAPDRIGTDGAAPYPPAIAASRKEGLLPRDPVHYVTKHLQQGIESDHFRVKRPMPRIGGFQSFHTARRTIRGFEAMLWLRKGFGFAGAWTVREQNQLLAYCFGLLKVNEA